MQSRGRVFDSRFFGRYEVVIAIGIDVINVYNVYKKNLCKRVYYFVSVYLNKNHMSETKQNYDSDEDN